MTKIQTDKPANRSQQEIVKICNYRLGCMHMGAQMFVETLQMRCGVCTITKDTVTRV